MTNFSPWGRQWQQQAVCDVIFFTGGLFCRRGLGTKLTRGRRTGIIDLSCQTRKGGGGMNLAHSNVTDQIVQYFKENITAGIWTVGEKIPSENQLTETLGVSRASIRTAIQQLVGIGVLESRHGKGTFLMDDQVDEMAAGEGKITAQDCRDMQKVLEFRRIVESEACYLAAEHATDELIEMLQECLDRMASNKENREEFITADIRFHELLCSASQNPLVEKSMSKVFEEARKEHSRTYGLFGFKDGIYFHTLILNAIKSGNAKRARESMFEHLQQAIDKLNQQTGK